MERNFNEKIRKKKEVKIRKAIRFGYIMKLLLSLFVFILLVGSCSTYKSFSSSLFESKDGKFKIHFLGPPAENSEMVSTEVGDIEMFTFLYEKSATEAYMVAYNDYPSSILDFSTPKELLAGGKNGVVNSMGITEFEIEKEISKSGNPGLYFKGTSGVYFVEYEMYLVKNRLYQIGLLRDGSYPTKERVKEFFGSFKFIK